MSAAGLLLAALLGCAAPASRAQGTDPPGRAARLSDVEGWVSLQPAGVPDWTAATLNRPLTTGDRLWSDQNSRAELDLGTAAIRLGDGTGFSFLNLDDNVAQMQLTAGTLIVHVRDMEPGQIYEVDTPNLALSLAQPGDYRVEVNNTGDTTIVKVGDGGAQAAGGGETVAIGPQERVTFTGSERLAYVSSSLGAPDNFDAWSAAREQQVEDSAAGEYVSDTIPGAQDLDNNGQWQDTPDYGYVWVPTAVQLGWVPYQLGNWVWISPWGWTWIDSAPWGYAPFHYGRWMQWRNSWAWVPGPRGASPMYAPALVMWVSQSSAGTAPGLGGTVGWFPLAPGEVYAPPYAASAAYVRRLNMTNTSGVNNTYITNIYQHLVTPTHYANNRPAAVSAVPADLFASGQRLDGRALRVSAAALAGSIVSATTPLIPPTLRSVLGASVNRRAAAPPPALVHRSVVVHSLPPPPPVPFDAQLAALQANGGRPLERAQLAQLQPPVPNPAVRAVAVTSHVVAANGLARSPVVSQAGAAASRPAASAAPAPSLSERERILESSRLPAVDAAQPSMARANAFVPPDLSSTISNRPPVRTEHPPSAPPDAAALPQRTFPEPQASGQPAATEALPVYRPPVAEPDAAAAESPTESVPPVPTYQAPPPGATAPRAPVPQPRPPAPAHAATHPHASGEPRDSPAHADRESRERLTR